MAMAGAYTTTGIKFHRACDTVDVGKVRRTFLCPFSFASWAIDPWPLRVEGLIVLVSPN